MVLLKSIKTIASSLVLIIMASFNSWAQETDKLVGTWSTTHDYEGQTEQVTYEFKNDKAQVKAISISTKDDKGNEKKDSSQSMEVLSFKNGKGKAKYAMKYEGETYEVDANLKMMDPKTLHISYSYYGLAFVETWKKVN